MKKRASISYFQSFYEKIIKIKRSQLASLLIYLSLGFVVFMLFSNDYFQIPSIRRWDYLLYSMLFLVLGLLLQGAAWYQLLKRSGIDISMGLAMSSEFLNIFSKYIPGKIWTIISPANFISAYTDRSLDRISFLSFQMQLLSIWAALIVGVFTFFFIPVEPVYIVFGVSGLILISFCLFNDFLRQKIQLIVNRILKKKLNLSFPSFRMLRYVLLYDFTRCFCWAISFTFLLSGVIDISLNIGVGFAFNFAGVIGTLAIMVPGGIGIKEGILAGLLLYFGVSIQEGIMVSLLSRVLFLIGEFIVFLLGIFFYQNAKLLRK